MVRKYGVWIILAVLIGSVFTYSLSTAISAQEDDMSRWDEEAFRMDALPYLEEKPWAESTPHQTIESTFVEASDSFITKRGGKGIVLAEAESKLIQLQRGSSIAVPVELTYVSSPTNDLGKVDLIPLGVGTGYIPTEFAKTQTPEERFQELRETGRISTMLDLSSTVSFDSDQLTVNPGESITVPMTISLPQDWPEETIGDIIWYSHGFSTSQPMDPKEFRVAVLSFQVQVTG